MSLLRSEVLASTVCQSHHHAIRHHACSARRRSERMTEWEATKQPPPTRESSPVSANPSSWHSADARSAIRPASEILGVLIMLKMHGMCETRAYEVSDDGLGKSGAGKHWPPSERLLFKRHLLFATTSHHLQLFSRDSKQILLEIEKLRDRCETFSRPEQSTRRSHGSLLISATKDYRSEELIGPSGFSGTHDR